MDVPLTDEEAVNALLLAKEHKWKQQEQQRVQQRRAAIKAELMRPWNAIEMLDYVQYRAMHELKLKYKNGTLEMPGMCIDDDNRDVINWLCMYFTNDPTFTTTLLREEKSGKQHFGDLNKGILLAGDVGTGKTTLLRCFGSNQRASYDMVPIPQLCDLYAEDGRKTVEIFSNLREAIPDRNNFFQRYVGQWFDDMGTEREKKHFGNSKNVMSDIILNRYNNKHLFGFQYTHITTNLTADQIEEIYGQRELSRIYEMFNIIHLKGGDRRRR